MNVQLDIDVDGQERPRFGFTNEELAKHPTVYRDDLLKDQTIIISGGGTGMGKAMAFLATRLGANVVLCGRTASKLEAAQSAIEVTCGTPSPKTPREVQAEPGPTPTKSPAAPASIKSSDTL